MAFLIIQHLGRTTAGVYHGAVIVGRKARNALVIDHPDVSRRHARVAKTGGEYFISDMGSRTGTRVNGQPISRQKLSDGDEISIGPATILFRRGVPFPADIQPVRLQATGRFRKELSDRRSFDCPCGKVIEVALPLKAKRAKCGSCRQIVSIPVPLAEAPPPAQADSVEPCSVCLCALESSDEKISCPECGLRFHADCWAENRGCSAYGCSQVGVLDEGAAQGESESDDADAFAEDVGESGSGRPLDSILHAASAARGWLSRRGGGR